MFWVPLGNEIHKVRVRVISKPSSPGQVSKAQVPGNFQVKKDSFIHYIAPTTTIATTEEITTDATVETTAASSAITFPEAGEGTPEEIAAAAAKDAIAAADVAKAAAEKAQNSAALAAAAAGSK